MKPLRPENSAATDSADQTRRSFFWKLGAGVSTALASTAAIAGDASPKGDAENLSLRVALLEEEKALRKLHQAFEKAMDDGRYEDVIGMFAEDAEVVFNGGAFANRSHGVSRLYRGHFQAGKSGKRMEPAPGFELDAGQIEDTVEVSADRLSAEAVFPYSIQVGKPLEADTSLVTMARLQGEGVRIWWEGGVYELTYGREIADGHWKISRLVYRTLSRADYRAGRSYARPIAVSAMVMRYPEDPQGPDVLV